MEDSSVREVFASLKPLCDSLANNPNVHNAKVLGNYIERRSNAAVQYNLEYILLPIYVHLHNDKLRLYLSAIKCLFHFT